MSESSFANADSSELVITRVLNAPRDLVFKAWTDSEQLKHWWGPKGFAWVSCELDLRRGGVFHYHMRGPGGNDMWGKFVYGEIHPPASLEFIVSFSNEKAETVRAPFNENWPLEVFNRVEFSEQDGRTTMTLTGGPHNANVAEHEAFRNMFTSMQQGFGGTFEQLEAYLAKLTGGSHGR